MEKLNLTPQERRLVAGVGLIVFVFLNIWLVWPHFNDWRRISDERDKGERTLKRYQNEVNQTTRYQRVLRELEQMGESVLSDEQDLNLMSTVVNQAQTNKLEVYDTREVKTATTQTNQFFDEKAVDIKFRAGTEELVNFLESLTSTNSLIRVRDMTLRPEPPNAPNRLSADLVLIASYQRKTPAKPAAAPASVATTASTKTPASNPATKTAATATKTNVVTKQGSGSKQGSGANVLTNKSPAVSSTNKAAIPKRKPSEPSLPKS